MNESPPPFAEYAKLKARIAELEAELAAEKAVHTVWLARFGALPYVDTGPIPPVTDEPQKGLNHGPYLPGHGCKRHDWHYVLNEPWKRQCARCGQRQTWGATGVQVE